MGDIYTLPHSILLVRGSVCEVKVYASINELVTDDICWFRFILGSLCYRKINSLWHSVLCKISNTLLRCLYTGLMLERVHIKVVYIVKR